MVTKMTGILEFKEKIKAFYAKNEVFIFPVVKFLLAFAVLSALNGKLGYMTRIDNAAIVLIVALACSFLPTASITLFAAMFSLLHMYALSIETALLGLSLYLLMFLLFFRVGSKYSLVLVITPMMFLLKIPYVMPIALGLIGTPGAAVALGCGVAVHFYFQTIINQAPTIATMGNEELTAKVRLLIDGFLNNRTMLVMIAAFAITVVVVYLIRRMSIDYSWTVAIVAGCLLNLVILLVGDLMYDTNMSVVGAILGTVLAAVVAKGIEFFRFCVDYSRTEKVQFEDDEYYYYVKAVPKMTVAAQNNTVKKINTQRRSAPARTSGSGRTVTTERTATGRSGYSQSHLTGGRSVTINSESMTDEETDDYEEIF